MLRRVGYCSWLLAISFIVVVIVVAVTVSAVTSLTNAERVAIGLAELTASSYISVGCVGLLLDPHMGESDRNFMLGIRMYLKSYPVSVMMITSQEASQQDKNLCMRQHTLIVAPKSYPSLQTHLEEFTHSPGIWNYRMWMVLAPESPKGESEHTWFEQSFPFDISYNSGLLVMLNSSRLLRLFRFKPELPILTQNLGDFNTTENKFQMKLDNTRVNLRGLIIKIAVQNSSLSSVQNINGVLRLVDGVYANIWNLLEKEFNFTTEVILTNKHGWFRNKRNGGWKEIESLLLDGTADAVVSGLVFSPAKSQDFYISPTIFFRRYFIYVRDPNSNAIIEWDIFTSPFSGNLWLVLGCTIFGIALTLFCMRQFFGYHIWDQEEMARYSFGNCLFSSYRAFCNQGQENEPRAISIRVVIITTYITSMLILTSYSGVLISFLTTGRVPLPFDSLQQILTSGTYQIGAKVNTSAMNFFQLDEEGMALEIYKKLIARNPLNFALTNEQGLRRVCSTNFAFVISMETEINLDQYPCKIIKLHKKYIYNELAIAFNKSFRIELLFSDYFQNLKDFGILSKIDREMLIRFKLTSTVIESPTVDITQVTPLLVELGAATVLSALFLFLEKLFRRSFSSSKTETWNEPLKSNRPDTLLYFKAEKNLL